MLLLLLQLLLRRLLPVLLAPHPPVVVALVTLLVALSLSSSSPPSACSCSSSSSSSSSSTSEGGAGAGSGAGGAGPGAGAAMSVADMTVRAVVGCVVCVCETMHMQHQRIGESAASPPLGLSEPGRARVRTSICPYSLRRILFVHIRVSQANMHEYYSSSGPGPQIVHE